MRTRTVPIASIAVITAACGLALWATQPIARSDGVSGKTQSATGCSCHSSTPNSGVTVTMSGPQAVAPGSTNSYTITVSGGPAGTTGGFDLMATGGTLVPGTGSKLLNTELVHADNTHRSWTFDWTAPVTDGPISMYAVAQSTNGSGSSGDGWNFYGGAINTAFVIDVNHLVGVGDAPMAGLSLGVAFPNPTAGATNVTFVLPAPARANVAVYNAAGRRVATLLAADLPAGTHVVGWNGRTDDGAEASMGLYFLRLTANGVDRTTRVVKTR